MTHRIGIATVLAAAGLALAGAANALAATTIGSNLAGSATSSIACGESCTIAHQTLPMAYQAPGGVLAPIDGVVVRWRISGANVARTCSRTSASASRPTKRGS